jgi:hydroxyacylglutathione hydrolase
VLDAGRPLALFSGGALIVGGVARTDLISPDQTEPLTRAAWHSLQRLAALPDDLPVYPTHGAGSFCSTPGDAERTSTIGAEWAHNPLLAAPEEQAFTERLLGTLGSFPPYFLRLREVNRRGPRVLDDRDRTLPALPVEQVRRHLADGALLVDVRPARSFAAGHPAGALSIVLRPGFASCWAGWSSPTGPWCLSSATGRAAASCCARPTRSAMSGCSASWRAGWRLAGRRATRRPGRAGRSR